VLKIDKREPKTIIRKVTKLAKENDVEYSVEVLPVGDYIWDDCIVIERKTIQDFINSLRSGHLETQLLDMEQYSHSYLMVSGKFESVTFNPYIKGWTVNHTIGALCSIAARYDVKMIQLANDTQLSKAIFKIREMVNKGRKTGVVKRHSKTLNVINPSFSLYLAIPGIGEKTAEKIDKAYPKFLDKIVN